jgi:hypothetical protein
MQVTFFVSGIQKELAGEMPLFLTLMQRALSSSSISSTSTKDALIFSFGGTIPTLTAFCFKAHISFFLVLTSRMIFEGSISTICKVSITISNT